MPVLQIIAGCNGSGKSYFSDFFVQNGIIFTQPVNIDALEIYIDTSTIPNDPLRYAKAIKKEIDKIFLKLCMEAIMQKRDFAFECNLRKDQLQYVSHFANAGYSLQLIFLWLDNIELSKERVEIRVNEGGHSLGITSIKQNFHEGVSNLDLTVSDFHWDHVMLIDNSKSAKTKGETLFFLLEIDRDNIELVSDNFFNKSRMELLPKICKLIKESKKSSY